MANDLPKEFDVVVLGTGMPESILAAAFSRIGHSVLHLDRNDFYSGDWASFNLDGIQKWVENGLVGRTLTDDEKDTTKSLQRPTVDENSLLEEGETLIQLPLEQTNFSNVSMQFHVSEAPEPEDVILSAEENNSQASLPLSDVNDKPECNQGDADNAAVGLDNTATGSESSKQEVENSADQTGSSSQADNQSSGSKEEVVEQLGKLELTGTPDSLNNTANTEALLEDQSVKTDPVAESKEETEVKTGADNQAESTSSTATETPAKPVLPKQWNATELKTEWRRYNLDLSPKILYSTGKMVNLLISSDIAKYCEFKTVTRVLTVMNGNIEKVPCSRADVFSSKKVSMLEKRMLMKFLKFCLEYEEKPEETQDYLEKPFIQFLESRKLTSNVRHFIQHSISMATNSMTTKQGLAQTKKFLQSIGRYGNTAFLWSLYGSGELPQSFCRMCAVFGGIYCLRMSASSVIIDQENRCKAVVTTEGQRIACKWLIMNNSYAVKSFMPETPESYISRCIVITDKPVLPSDSQELSLMRVPCPDDGDRPVTVLELPSSSMACPAGLYVIHLTRQSKRDTTPADDLAFVTDLLFSSDDEEKPKLLWSLYFTQVVTPDRRSGENCPPNIILLPGPGTDVDIDKPVLEAEEIFQRILPDEEFLPKAPNPEDIIHVDDAEAQVNKENDQSEFSESPSNGSPETDQSAEADRFTAEGSKSSEVEKTKTETEDSKLVSEVGSDTQTASSSVEDVALVTQGEETS